MNIVILAAGYGTRLYPLTVNTPKPLLEVNNKPIINYLIEKIDNLKNYCPVSGVSVVSNNRFHPHFLKWRNKNQFDIEIVNDGSNTPEDRKGAIKAIQLALKQEGEDCLVVGGDNIFEDDLTNFIDFSLHVRPHPCIALYDVKKKEEATRFGVVKLDEKSRIIELIEKPQKPSSTLVATCVYFFPYQSMRYLHEYLANGAQSDVAGKYIEWVLKKSPVYGSTLTGEWLDIGSKEALREAEKALARV
ncbi:MAG: nucleotidyltransferase family protein [Candidatus Omnitrophica bacterium]|nr:nucleotidyltransferase family protein [Candidatus Omnitrophota bacterium]